MCIKKLHTGRSWGDMTLSLDGFLKESSIPDNDNHKQVAGEIKANGLDACIEVALLVTHRDGDS